MFSLLRKMQKKKKEFEDLGIEMVNYVYFNNQIFIKEGEYQINNCLCH